ncbi:BrnA antitoxin family protein [Jiella avicenniae]|uniref:BrnA antitoxin family protein n=1 Tax=Jiella avicenniae TaxID=2907202 RepID=A0A9X1T3R8_9HYPH|nr:BrnA antitoxin family protein [Jiella avicenniae]MCE7027941.1 BrnA antitoxin family protein [Jiella avicenniae]
MSANRPDTGPIWTDPDDAPELTDEWFAGATVHKGGVVKRLPGKRGRGRKPAKESVTLRLDPEVLAFFRNTGPGWQTRLNEALKGFVSETSKGRH